jgi:Sodium/hydrogen exchanger family
MHIAAAGMTATVFLRLAELGLVLLLFTDASHTDLTVLRSIGTLPGRLLSTGMLLTILLGGIVARLVFPGLSIWEAGILSAILAPTDAGLGQVVVSSPRVPMRIRAVLGDPKETCPDPRPTPFVKELPFPQGREHHHRPATPQVRFRRLRLPWACHGNPDTSAAPTAPSVATSSNPTTSPTISSSLKSSDINYSDRTHPFP